MFTTVTNTQASQRQKKWSADCKEVTTPKGLWLEKVGLKDSPETLIMTAEEHFLNTRSIEARVYCTRQDPSCILHSLILLMQLYNFTCPHVFLANITFHYCSFQVFTNKTVGSGWQPFKLGSFLTWGTAGLLRPCWVVRPQVALLSRNTLW